MLPLNKIPLQHGGEACEDKHMLLSCTQAAVAILRLPAEPCSDGCSYAAGRVAGGEAPRGTAAAVVKGRGGATAKSR